MTTQKGTARTLYLFCVIGAIESVVLQEILRLMIKSMVEWIILRKNSKWL